MNPVVDLCWFYWTHSAEITEGERGHQLHFCQEQDLCFEKGRISIFLQPHCSFYIAAPKLSALPCFLSLICLRLWIPNTLHSPNTFFSFSYSTMPTANHRAADHDTDWREGPWYRDGEIDWYKTSSLKVKRRERDREQRGWNEKHWAVTAQIEVMPLISDSMSAESAQVMLWWHSPHYIQARSEGSEERTCKDSNS